MNIIDNILTFDFYNQTYSFIEIDKLVNSSKFDSIFSFEEEINNLSSIENIYSDKSLNKTDFLNFQKSCFKENKIINKHTKLQKDTTLIVCNIANFLPHEYKKVNTRSILAYELNKDDKFLNYKSTDSDNPLSEIFSEGDIIYVTEHSLLSEKELDMFKVNTLRDEIINFHNQKIDITNQFYSFTDQFQLKLLDLMILYIENDMKHTIRIVSDRVFTNFYSKPIVKLKFKHFKKILNLLHNKEFESLAYKNILNIQVNSYNIPYLVYIIIKIRNKFKNSSHQASRDLTKLVEDCVLILSGPSRNSDIPYGIRIDSIDNVTYSQQLTLFKYIVTLCQQNFIDIFHNPKDLNVEDLKLEIKDTLNNYELLLYFIQQQIDKLITKEINERIINVCDHIALTCKNGIIQVDKNKDVSNLVAKYSINNNLKFNIKNISIYDCIPYINWDTLTLDYSKKYNHIKNYGQINILNERNVEHMENDEYQYSTFS